MSSFRWMCISLKRLQCVLMCLILIACVVPVYYNYNGLLITTLYKSISINSLRQYVPTSFSFQGEIFKNQRLTTRQLGKPNGPSPTNLTCKAGQGLATKTACPTCFRPAVGWLETNFSDIGYEDPVVNNETVYFFKAKKEVLEHLIQEYVLVPGFNCSNVYLLAIQPSVLNKQNERDTVRSTWGSVAKEQRWPNRNINANVKVIFVVARQTITSSGKNNSSIIQRQLKEITLEAKKHDDILYLDMIDGYKRLTLKLLSAFKWVKDNCPCVKFVLKVDYDAFVNVPLLVDTLLYFEDRFEFSIIGNVYFKQKEAKRQGRWAVPKSLYLFNEYPKYASGGGYVLSNKVLSKIVDTVPHFQMFPIEDAFITGIIRRVIGCQIFNFPTMFTTYNDKKWHYCLMFEDKKIVGMTVNGDKHSVIWNSFVNGTCK